MATKAQLRANKKYEKDHPEQTKLKQANSRAKWFIKHCDITLGWTIYKSLKRLLMSK